MDVCPCDHVAGEAHSHHPSDASVTGPASRPETATDTIAAALNKLAEVQATTAQAFTAAMQQGGSRNTFKTVTMLDFERGSDRALED